MRRNDAERWLTRFLGPLSTASTPAAMVRVQTCLRTHCQASAQANFTLHALVVPILLAAHAEKEKSDSSAGQLPFKQTRCTMPCLW